jgi:AAA+ superfamily predicted ATPase
MMTLNTMPWFQVCSTREHLSSQNLIFRTVFLRQLEYYSGIIFLTTNRVGNFDPAIMSRIHLSIEYRPLSQDAKAQIWESSITKVLGGHPKWLDEVSLLKLASEELDGRSISNLVKTASTLARSRGSELSVNEIGETLELKPKREFGKYLDGPERGIKKRRL